VFLRYIKTFTGDDCQRGSVLFSADPKRQVAVKDAKHALGLATEDRLKLVVAMDSSEDECDDDDDDDDDDGGKENDSEEEESMVVDESLTGKLWSLDLLGNVHFIIFVKICAPQKLFKLNDF